MIDSQWLDIAIGVAFVWFLFALTVTAINEGISRVLAMRSKQLWKALRQILDGTDAPTSLIRNAFQVPFWSKRPKDPASPANVTNKLYGTKTVQALETRTGSDKKTRISNLPAQVFSQALIELVNAASTDSDVEIRVTSYIQSAGTPLAQQLGSLWTSANSDLKEYTAEIERWFDAQMSRLSTIYKSQIRFILVPIGLIVAVAGFGLGLRTDALALVTKLQNDSAFRHVVVVAASDAVKSDLRNAGCPPKGVPDAAKNQTQTDCEIAGASKLKNIDFVVHSDTTSQSKFWQRLGFLFSWPHWRAMLGVLITGLAISFGSTFWFDLLRRLLGMRRAPPTAT